MVEAATKLEIKSGDKEPRRVAEAGGTSLLPTTEGMWAPMAGLRSEIDRLFDDVQRGTLWSPFGRRWFDFAPLRRTAATFSLNVPSVDVVEKDKEYQITAEMPGMDEKAIEVSVSDDMLTIKGEKKEESEEKRKDYHLAERRYGAFRRSFQLPAGTDAGKIEANFRNGVLTLTLPKTQEAQAKTRKIAIKAS